MATVFLAEAQLHSRKGSLHSTLLLVRNVTELRKKLESAYNQFEIYSDMVEEVPEDILQKQGQDSYEMESFLHSDCRMLFQVYDKLELP